MDTRFQTETAKEKYAEAEARVRESVEDHPTAAVFAAFGVGLGVGLAIGVAIAEATTSQKRSHNTMEEFGRSVMDAASKFVPNFK